MSEINFLIQFFWEEKHSNGSGIIVTMKDDTQIEHVSGGDFRCTAEATGNCDVNQFQFKVCGNQTCRALSGGLCLGQKKKKINFTLNVKICASQSVYRRTSALQLQQLQCFRCCALIVFVLTTFPFGCNLFNSHPAEWVNQTPAP